MCALGLVLAISIFGQAKDLRRWEGEFEAVPGRREAARGGCGTADQRGGGLGARIGVGLTLPLGITALAPPSAPLPFTSLCVCPPVISSSPAAHFPATLAPALTQKMKLKMKSRNFTQRIPPCTRPMAGLVSAAAAATPAQTAARRTRSALQRTRWQASGSFRRLPLPRLGGRGGGACEEEAGAGRGRGRRGPPLPREKVRWQPSHAKGAAARELKVARGKNQFKIELCGKSTLHVVESIPQWRSGCAKFCRNLSFSITRFRPLASNALVFLGVFVLFYKKHVMEARV